MIFYKEKEKIVIYPFLITLLLTAGIVFGVHLFISSLGSCEKSIKKFQAEISSKEKIVEKEILQISKSYSKNKDQFEENIGSFKFDKNGIGYFIYQNDSLVFWSTNAIPGIDHPEKFNTLPDGSLVKLSNGWYYFLKRKEQSETIIGLILLQHCYAFNNQYLQSNFQQDFQLPEGSEILEPSGNNLIFSNKGKPLFSLKLPQTVKISMFFEVFYLGLFVVAFILFIYVVYIIYNSLKSLKRRKALFLVTFFISVIIIRLFFLSFRIPATLFSLEFFNPLTYASSQLSPSLGDFFLNAIVLLILSLAFYFLFPSILRPVKKSTSSFFPVIIGNLSILTGAFLLVYHSFRSIILNSSFSLDLQNISNLDIFSVLGLIIISILLISFILVLLCLFSVTRAVILAKPTQNIEIERAKLSLSKIILLITISSIISTLTLNFFNNQKEKEKRELFALKLGVERDPVAELMFSSTEKEMINDSIFRGNWKQVEENELLIEDQISQVIRQKFFQSRWSNYSIQITLCYGKKQLRIQPYNTVSDCEQYFQGIIKNYGKQTSSPNLFFLDFGFGYKNYLAKIPLKEKTKASLVSGMAYIEISSKLAFNDLGYPGLLIDNKFGQIKDFSIYSYAFYRNYKLTQRFGDFNYDLSTEPHHKTRVLEPHFYREGAFSHYCYPINEDDFLLVSRKEPSFMDRIAPFSYLFFFFSLTSLVFLIIIWFIKGYSFPVLRMGERIQIVMTTIIFLSLFLVGGIVIQYITKLNQRKNDENLTEKTYSVLVEFQHKYDSLETFNDQGKLDLIDQLTKLSNVYFTDINLFNPAGKLIASSRPEVFEKGLLSNMMNPMAFDQIKSGAKSFYLNREKIGNHAYHSAYIPVYNDKGHLLAFINLPSFARQEDLKKEISSFLVNFINAYAAVIILGIMVSLLIGFYITKPLKILIGKISAITFGKKNEKIVWQRKDEIGHLVDEYNRMVEELEKTADLLIKSERESAWREMAKQVAHEIKNPLTPMKLSVQHIERLWFENVPDWDLRLKRFARTMTEQIDTLSSIAVEFEMFAKMPQPHRELLNVDEIVKTILGLYANIPSIKYQVTPQAAQVIVSADKKQLFRAFTNLINNSLHAIEDNPEGYISIFLEYENKGILIRISDNGVGIPEEQKGQIFLPNFTTKTTGMGLGLAIVKNIIEEVDGQISFVSEKGKGTVFTIWIPGRPNQ